jgi:molybdate transport system substrate-binding protein
MLVSLVIGAALAAGLSPSPAAATAEMPLTIAAASDLQPVLPALVERFKTQTGHQVRLTFGSSGNFFSQIQNGAPFDLFLSADVEYPMRLETLRLTEPGSLYRYATGRIVLWSRKDTGIELQRGLPVLIESAIRRIAVANPAHAPYGRAAVAALQHQGLYDRVRSKLVIAENISQAAQFVESGNAEVGILALSLAVSPALRQRGTYYEIPPTAYPPIQQAAVILKTTRPPDAARQFLAFLQQPESRRLLREAGFMVGPPPTR